MKTVQKGFTLIELMIVVAIIAILAAIALPAYQNYTKRAKVSEAIVAIDACKTSVSEYFSSQAIMPSDANTAGCTTAGTQYVSGLSVSAGSVIATTTNIATDANGTITYTPTTTTNSASGTQITSWACTSAITNKSVLPALCRNN
jgi:type IV pilus assembly protein PilA